MERERFNGLQQTFGVSESSVGVIVGAEQTPSGKGAGVFARIGVRKEDDK